MSPAASRIALLASSLVVLLVAVRLLAPRRDAGAPRDVVEERAHARPARLGTTVTGEPAPLRAPSGDRAPLDLGAEDPPPTRSEASASTLPFTIQGSVRSFDGGPVEGVELSLELQARPGARPGVRLEPPARGVATDREGRFRFEGPWSAQALAGWRLRGVRPGFAELVHDVLLEDESQAGLDLGALLLPPLAPIRGSVASASVADWSSWRVLAVERRPRAGGWAWPRRSPRAGLAPTGEFLLASLPPGSFTLELHHPVLGCVERRDVVTGAGGGSVDFAYEGPDPSRCLLLSVHAEVQLPDDAVRVRTRGLWTTARPLTEAGRSRRFLAVDLPEGPCAVSVEVDGQVLWHDEVLAPGQRVDVRALPSGGGLFDLGW